MHLDELSREFSLQQRVAAAPNRLVRCKAVKSLGSAFQT